MKKLVNRIKPFKRKGVLFMPGGFFGWLILLFALFCFVYTFIIIDSKSHSVSDTLINFFFYAVIFSLAYTLIAYLISMIKNKTKEKI
jgi:hypothetical protein